MYQKKLFPHILIVSLYLVHDPSSKKKTGTVCSAHHPLLMLDILTYEVGTALPPLPRPPMTHLILCGTGTDSSEVRLVWVKCREPLSQCTSDKLSQALPAGSEQESTLYLTPGSCPPPAQEPLATMTGWSGQVSWSRGPAPHSLVWSSTLPLPAAPLKAGPWCGVTSCQDVHATKLRAPTSSHLAPFLA